MSDNRQLDESNFRTVVDYLAKDMKPGSVEGSLFLLGRPIEYRRSRATKLERHLAMVARDNKLDLQEFTAICKAAEYEYLRVIETMG